MSLSNTSMYGINMSDNRYVTVRTIMIIYLGERINLRFFYFCMNQSVFPCRINLSMVSLTGVPNMSVLDVPKKTDNHSPKCVPNKNQTKKK